MKLTIGATLLTVFAVASGCQTRQKPLLQDVLPSRAPNVLVGETGEATSNGDVSDQNKAFIEAETGSSIKQVTFQEAVETNKSSNQLKTGESTFNLDDVNEITTPDFESAVDLPNDAEEPNKLQLGKLQLEDVLQSTLQFYPEIDAALSEFQIALGELTQAQGSFDTKLKAASENTPVGFYETYRSKFGIEQPTFNGGSLFAGYKFGRGDIEPWYLERNTNAGGELSFGAQWSLLRNRQIDARRVKLWKAQLKQNAVEPIVRQQLLKVFRDSEIAFWDWVAAGQIYQRNLRLLQAAKNRVDGIEERIKLGDIEKLARTDNNRTILSREVKLIKAKAKLDQAAIKLSLYYRDIEGLPIIASYEQIPSFQDVQFAFDEVVEVYVSEALRCRPEINLISLDLRKNSVEIAKARNDLLPEFNARIAASQDFGRPTSASAAASSSTQTLFVFFDEKDEFQVDAGLFLSQDLQRRKANGKIQSLCGKRNQLQLKRQLLEQKIEAEVRQNYQLTSAANEQIKAAKQTYELAKTLSNAAGDRLASGDVDLFEIILREQQELDAAIELALSQLNFFINRANLIVSTGCDEYQAYDSLLDF